MGNLRVDRDRYLWRPEPRGPIYVRISFRLPGDSQVHRFVKSLGTTSYPEARRIRDRAFAPLLTSLRCARTAHDFVQFVVKSAESVLGRDLSLVLDGLGMATAQGSAVTPAACDPASPQNPARKTNGLAWGTLSKMYMDHIRARKARSTVMRYQVQVEVLDEFFGRNTPVQEIDRKKVGSLLGLLESQGKLADTTINVTIARAGAIFRFGKARGLVEGNPSEGVRIEGVQHKAGRPFTREEADRVVAMEPPQRKHYPQWAFHAFSMIARYTGARIGEIAVVEAADVVKTEGVRCLLFRTEKTRSRGGRSHKEEHRFVPIAPKLSSTIDECLRRHATGRLFPRNGQWKWKQAHLLGRDFNRLVKKVAPGASFHSWRHYAVSEMLNTDVPDEIRKQIVGHKDGSVHGIYSHAYIQRMFDAVSTIY